MFSGRRLLIQHTCRRPAVATAGAVKCRPSVFLTKTTTYASTRTVRQSSRWQTMKQHVVTQVRSRPIEYLSIPCVAAFVGISTNWMGVKMLFYPIDYWGYNVVPREPLSPYGFFGWQGVVPTKTVIMAERLVRIITTRLLSLQEAFARLEPAAFSQMVAPVMQQHIHDECGSFWATLINPVLPRLLPYLFRQLQNEIDQVLDLHDLVLSAFVRDKVVLVELFQKVGRVELEFLVNTGFGFGFGLGLLQMVAWAGAPQAWTLPAAGALVGYITNWIAIKLLFEPADPVDIYGLFQIQGLFESRQIEVSNEFGAFMERRVLNPSSLLHALADGDELMQFLRRHLPGIPNHVLQACVHSIQHIANHPNEYREIHRYLQQRLDIENTLAARLKLLSPTGFEDLLHPVFQEDEITLIATGGVLGAAAGMLQTQLGWGGPKAFGRAVVTILGSLALSAVFYVHQKYEEFQDDQDPPVSAQARPALRRRQTVVRIKPLEEEDWYREHYYREHER